MNTTKKYKIANFTIEGLFRSVRGLFGDAAKTSYFISMQQNDYKERSLEVYSKWYKKFKRAHYFELWRGNMNQMDLEKEAHRFGLSMTFSTLREFEDIDKSIFDQTMRTITEAPKNFISAMIDVLGKETDDSQGVYLPPEVVQRLLDLYSFLEQRWKNR